MLTFILVSGGAFLIWCLLPGKRRKWSSIWRAK
jgi:hypothetical protein